jgi:hypothetical protein
MISLVVKSVLMSQPHSTSKDEKEVCLSVDDVIQENGNVMPIVCNILWKR